jgi:hypothetical protein
MEHVWVSGAVALSLMACGDVAQSGPRDAGRSDVQRIDAQHVMPIRRDGGRVDDVAGRSPPPVYVDAGEYHGDGSFFVDGGAHSDAGTPGDASDHTDATADGGAVDATAGCAPLSACCVSLPSTSEALCNEVVAQGQATACATELVQLQNSGNCMGVSVIASQVQVPPSWLVSDGTSLFWTTNESPGLLAMPVGGGTITVLVNEPITNASGGFLAVDSVNIYVQQADSLIRIPKNGDAATLVTESGAWVASATVLGNTAYWVEVPGGAPSFSNPITALAVKSAPLEGGPISTIAQFATSSDAHIGVTASTVFLVGLGPSLKSFPVTGIPASGMTTVTAGQNGGSLASDTDAVYNAGGESILRIASNGTGTSLGSAVDPSYIAFDDTFVYWADMTTVGTIMKAPKAGGGTATVLARDTSPTAIAVDANSVYWGDQDGYIKSVPKLAP